MQTYLMEKNADEQSRKAENLLKKIEQK